MSLDRVLAALRTRLTPPSREWLRRSVEQISASPVEIRGRFPAAGRRCGRGPLVDDSPYTPHELRSWTVDDGARTVLLVALPMAGEALAEEMTELYRYGDAAEKRGVLRGLGVLYVSRGLGGMALPAVRDALRTNDTRLVTAALGPYAADHLDSVTYRQGVLKCVVMGIPLTDIAGLDRRTDAELVRMLRAFADERLAAGRPVPADVWLIAPRRSDRDPT
jgi:hypothetical protein